MAAQVTLFPVENGDMTLIQLADADSTCLLVDCKIRAGADDPEDSTPDVAQALRDKLNRDSRGRPYVDAMLLSHPDEDHCLGLEKHFWLGPLSEYSDDDKPDCDKRIVIRQIWSSAMVFRRASKKRPLCDDAKAFNKEAKRRIKKNLDHHFFVSDGDKIQVLGEDENGRTKDLEPILVRQGEYFSGINGKATGYLTSLLIAPFDKKDDDDEELLSKNNSSVILNLEIKHSEYFSATSNFLMGGDAEVEIWERVWNKYEAQVLEYDLLLAPHHCSWHTLSYDSWSDMGEEAKISASARSALAQAKDGAIIVSSSKPIKDDENDPPCIRAKKEYRSILRSGGGLFRCTGEEPTSYDPKPLEIETTTSGFKLAAAASAALSMTSCSPPKAGKC